MLADKKKVCVIFGGQSPEHDISLKSVTSVINNLDKQKYDTQAETSDPLTLDPLILPIHPV